MGAVARPLRIDVEGGWYHVMSRGTERRTIFIDDGYRRHFLELVAEMSERYEVGVHAFVLMDNHCHLLIHWIESSASGKRREAADRTESRLLSAIGAIGGARTPYMPRIGGARIGCKPGSS